MATLAAEIQTKLRVLNAINFNCILDAMNIQIKITNTAINWGYRKIRFDVDYYYQHRPVIYSILI
jgi:hypothetical protein